MTETTTRHANILIMGAGSVGCYLGGRLLSAGANVTLVGRERLADVLRRNPLRVTDYEGFRSETHLTPKQFITDIGSAEPPDLVLVTVKSSGSETAARELGRIVSEATPVISMQNGISNAERIQSVLPQADVLPGMVPFNVLQQDPGHFHQGTESHLMCARHPGLEPLTPAFEAAGLPLEQRDDMLSVMWSKLLLNLNNPINALSGKPLLEQLSRRSYRRCLALAQRETLELLRNAGIPTVKLTPLPMGLIPTLMKAPDWLFTRLSGSMLAIDPIARSSMWEDLEAGRPTEVDWINGEVVKLARKLGAQAPVNAKLAELIHKSEKQRQTWDGDALLAALRSAQG